MPGPAAYAVAPDLHCRARDIDEENSALRRIAAWCYQYSHQVCLPPDRPGLLLEAGASKRLFGDAEALARRIGQELGRIGYRAVSGAAPTLEAAWLAAHDTQYLSRREDIRPRLGPLPLDYLQLDAETLRAMEGMGLRQVRDLLRLPRKSLTRRFGPALSTYLDRLLGLQPHPCRFYQPPEQFSTRLELLSEISLKQALLFPLRRLLEELCGVLRGSDTAVQHVNIALGHESSPDTRMRLGLQSPTQDPSRLMMVLRERLERLKLPAAVREVHLRAPRLLKFSPGQSHLFRDMAGGSQEGVAELAERLQARLGRESVAGITGVEDHRPELSWRIRALGESGRCTPLPHRPAWLLPRPRRCDIRNYEILSGPERIETGWWDGRDCRRDYFVVRDHNGCRLWAFHEYKPREGWYLHGIFS